MSRLMSILQVVGFCLVSWAVVILVIVLAWKAVH